MGRKTKEIVYSGCHVFSWMAIHIFMSIYFKWAWVTQKYFFLLNKSLQLFETYCTFLWVVKITKSSHHLLHNWASKGYGSIPGLMPKTSLHACLQRINKMQISLWHQTRNRPMPFTISVVWQMMARFHNFYRLLNIKIWVKKGQKGTMRFKQVQRFIWVKKIFWG